MGERLVDFLLARTGRERWLLLALVAVAVPVAIWLAVLEPLLQARAAAAARLQAEARLHAWVLDRRAEALALGRTGNAAGSASGAGAATGPIGVSGLEAALRQGGLREQVSGLARRTDDVIELTFEEVAFAALGAWLADVSPGWGYAIESYRIEPGSRPGTVSAAFTLRPVG